MHRRPTAALLQVTFLLTAASANAIPVDELVYEPPLNNSSLSGNMLTGETEFLTPVGILDDLPPSPAYGQIEPAAGPEDMEISNTIP